MSQRLKEAADYLPTFLHELELFDKLEIATIRNLAGVRIQYGDIRGAVELAKRSGIEPEPVRENWIAAARAISIGRKFTGIVHIGVETGVSLEPGDVEYWLELAKVGHAICDVEFLHGSVSRDVALRHGSDMLIRLLSCSGAIVRFEDSEDDEVMFNSGERFAIARIERRDYGLPFGKVWTVDAEEMYWPTPNVPHWPENDQ